MDDAPLTSIVGVMSGSSLDGVDLAYCSFSENGNYHIEHAKTIDYHPSTLTFLSRPFQYTTEEYIKACGHFDNVYSQIISAFIRSIDQSVDMIVSHGHTIYHDPDRGQSVQIGNGGMIASRTGIDTLCDLRIQDIALGGQGAPLAALVDRYIFQDYHLMMNLGGIANISVNTNGDTIAWDISPCNQALNHLAKRKGQPYDSEGQIAAMGKMNKALYQRLSSLSYFSKEAPKSLDNHWVQRQFISKIGHEVTVEDASYTICQFIADSTYRDLLSVRYPKPAKLMITGGGAHHQFLIELIKNKLSTLDIEVVVPDALLINYKEALLMAYMGYRYLTKKNNTVCSATGASKNIIAGALYKGNE